jgi:hypothetical protein
MTDVEQIAVREKCSVRGTIFCHSSRHARVKNRALGSRSGEQAKATRAELDSSMAVSDAEIRKQTSGGSGMP